MICAVRREKFYLTCTLMQEEYGMNNKQHREPSMRKAMGALIVIILIGFLGHNAHATFLSANGPAESISEANFPAVDRLDQTIAFAIPFPNGGGVTSGFVHERVRQDSNGNLVFDFAITNVSGGVVVQLIWDVQHNSLSQGVEVTCDNTTIIGTICPGTGNIFTNLYGNMLSISYPNSRLGNGKSGHFVEVYGPPSGGIIVYDQNGQLFIVTATSSPSGTNGVGVVPAYEPGLVSVPFPPPPSK